MEYLSSQPQPLLGQIYVNEAIKKEAELPAEQTAVDAKEQQFDKRSAQIQAYVNDQLATRGEISQGAQKELAGAVRLIGDISTTDKPWIRKNPELLGSIETAVRATLKEEPHMEYARRTLKCVHRRVHPMFGAGLWESLKRSMKTSPAAVVVVGLVVTFVLLTFVPLINRGLDLSSLTIGTFLNINPSVLLLIGVVGALGSIASIMLRIRDSAFEKYTASGDPWPWLFFGLFKPITGALFALFTFAVIKAGLLPVEITDATEGWYIVAIAFVAGFSERFGQNILSNTEGRIEIVSQSSPSTPSSADNANAAGSGKPSADTANAAEAEQENNR